MATNNPFDISTGKTTGSTGIVGGAMPASYTPLTSQVDESKELASSQVEKLLAKDSPLLQRARTEGLQSMSQRGLVNSSMASGASMAAMIDRVVPIAQQDAQTFSERSMFNTKSLNEGGMFNVGETNKFGLQRNEFAFTAGENKARRDFDAAQGELNRAEQRYATDKSIESAQALAKAQQEFTAAENKLNRQQEVTLAREQQQFQSSENAQNREQEKSLQQARFEFDAAQNNLTRAEQRYATDKSIESQRDLEAARQRYQSAENVLDRQFQSSESAAGRAFTANENLLDRKSRLDLQNASQSFQATENERDRAAQIMLADKNITANQAVEQSRQEFQAEQNGLDRTSARELAEANRTFQASQAEFDRAQQIMLADKNITANQAMEKSRQEFQASQATLDRDNQEKIIRLQDQLAQTSIPKSFATNLVSSTQASINALLADPNLSSEVDPQTGKSPKQQAIDNVIANANATLQWGASFYNTTLPGVAGPGGTSTPITPGGNAAPGGGGIVGGAIGGG